MAYNASYYPCMEISHECYEVMEILYEFYEDVASGNKI